MKYLVRFVIFLYFICIAFVDPVQSQESAWSNPIQLSNEQWSSLWPVIAADASGQVHVFWRERTGHVEFRNNPDTTIYYCRWDGVSWQPPVDVFVAPQLNGNVRVLAADVDSEGRLHVIWSGGRKFDEELFHSWAWVQLTISARSWTTESIDVGSEFTFGDLKIGKDDNLHVVYNEGTTHIYYRSARSLEGKYQWSMPIDLASQIDAQVVEAPQVALTRNGWTHVVWTENNIEGFGIGVYYIRSKDGFNWDPPLEVFKPEPDEEGGNSARWITIATDGEDNILLVWSRGVGRIDGRYYQWSEDNGVTWTEPRVMQEGYSGSTGHASLATDSNGQFHMITSAYHGGTFLYYSVWDRQNKRWSPFLRVTNINYDFSERQQMVITDGNLLHLVWLRWVDPAPILYSQLRLDAPEIAPMHYSTEPSGHSDLDNREPGLKNISEATPEPGLKALEINSTSKRLSQENIRASLLISTVPVLVLLATIVIVYQQKKK